MMNPGNTALILIGFQNDYFGADGVLRSVVEESSRANSVVENTVALIRACEQSDLTMVETPIVFTEDYSELDDPVGILKAIKEVGAFRAGTSGGETIEEFNAFGSRIHCVPGKRGLNAFSNTELENFLRERQISNVVIAGTVTSICVDSTGRSAHEKGFKVFVLGDCTSGRSVVEQEFYCEQIFPLYAEVISSSTLRERLLT